MIRVISLYIILSLSSGILSAQTLDDALRYSFFDYYSTARFSGVSGAFSPLGADVSVASINPAGIAEFRKSEITATLNFLTTENRAELDQVGTSRGLSKVGLGNIAAVFHNNPLSFNTKTFNIAVGYNRLADFNEIIEYEALSAGTIVQRFLEQANGVSLNDLGIFEAGPAFDAGAIFDPEEDQSYLSDFVTLRETINRAETITRTGSLNEIFISLGSNIKNKLSWGVTLGFPFLNYSEERRYTEDDQLDQVEFFENLAFNQNLSTSGVGANIKVGLIYKITPQLRLGAAIHSRSVFLLSEDFDTQVDYTFVEDGIVNSGSELSPLSENFEYQLQGAWRAIGGIGYLYKLGELRGFISGEVEYVNYPSASFNLTANSNDPLDQFFEQDLNTEIDDFLGSALNFKVGTELAMNHYRIRLGANMIDSPFQDEGILEYDLGLSGGLGYRGDRFYVDLAYTLRSFDTNYSPYALVDFNDEPFVAINQRRQLITATVGYKL